MVRLELINVVSSSSIFYSIRVCYMLNKYEKPFSDCEIVKEFMSEVAMAIFEEKNDVIVAVQGLQLSARRNTRRTEILAAENKSNYY